MQRVRGNPGRVGALLIKQLSEGGRRAAPDCSFCEPSVDAGLRRSRASTLSHPCVRGRLRSGCCPIWSATGCQGGLIRPFWRVFSGKQGQMDPIAAFARAESAEFSQICLVFRFPTARRFGIWISRVIHKTFPADINNLSPPNFHAALLFSCPGRA